MSNFNVPSPNASRSAISLGGEWRTRDQSEANKYKISGLGSFNRNRDKNKAKEKNSKDKTRERPSSSPSVKCTISPTDRLTPPKSAPPSAKPRCNRLADLEGQPAARKQLETHLSIRKTKSPRGTLDTEKSQQYNLGSGVSLTRSKSHVAVTINTGLPDLPESVPRGVFHKETPAQGDSERADPDDSHLAQDEKMSNWVQSGSGRGPKMSQLIPPPVGGTYRTGAYVGEGRFYSCASPHQTNSGFVEDRSASPVPSYQGNSRSLSVISLDVQDALVLQLQQQVCDLTLFLEEERLNHKATKEKDMAALREQLNDLERHHMEELREITQQQEDQVQMIKELHKKEMMHLKTSSNNALARMKGELEFLQGAFEAYKGTLVQDMEEKWNKKEIDMKLKFQEDKENSLQEQRQHLLEKETREKNTFSQEVHKQMQLVQKEHKREIDSMLMKFSSASVDVENLKKALDQLKRVQDELDNTVEELTLKEDELRQTRMELAETRLRTAQFEQNFKSQVDNVDGKYQERMHHILLENAEIRKRYMQKCDELFTEKSHTEKKRVETLMNTKEVMRMLVHVKHRSKVNLACSDPATDHQTKIPITRPFSAPVTKVDKQLAFRSAGETSHVHGSEGTMLATPVMPPRPKTVAAQRAKSNVLQDFSKLLPFRTDSLQSI